MAGFISDLDRNYPDGQLQRGRDIDDDLRDFKGKVLDTLVNANDAINPTPAELNRLVGVTADIQPQIDAIVANIVPSNAVTSFLMTAAPTGWTQRSDWNDLYPRFVSGTGGSQGGSYTITGLTMPHTHAGTTGTPNEGDINVQDGSGSDSVARQFHTQNFNTGQPSTNVVVHTPGWRLTYVDCIVCQKNAYTVP